MKSIKADISGKFITASNEKVFSRYPTCRCGIADGEGGQGCVQAIDSVVEMLGEEDVALHRLAGQGM